MVVPVAARLLRAATFHVTGGFGRELRSDRAQSSILTCYGLVPVTIKVLGRAFVMTR